MNRKIWLLAAAAGAIMTAPAMAQSVEAGIAAWRANNYEEAIRQWRPLADRGDADAQYNLAQAYKLGRGVPVNLNLAEQWYAYSTDRQLGRAREVLADEGIRVG